MYDNDYMFLNLTNAILKRKLDKIEAVAQELERGYKGGGAVLPGTPPHVSVGSGP